MKYQGHSSKTAWNVALWIGNDEPLYHAALDAKRRCKTLGSAARALQADLPTRTPDGYPFTLRAIREALAGLED